MTLLQSKLISDLQKKTGELSGQLSALERTAQQQLHALANHSEVAIDTAQAKLTEATLRIAEFHKFIKVNKVYLHNEKK